MLVTINIAIVQKYRSHLCTPVRL